ncbi:Hypothetical protein PHPALM_12201 [Phytophthora palmivora]|uniref:Peptidase A2 domain-containing protein n=1 Tax=Phytophthora palmivora TaxID=4796 RepID=A0A2P4Y0D8_9STRA|nr:Hypothetical protein PHPALM_12201 [Phytophthora palmivora]
MCDSDGKERDSEESDEGDSAMMSAAATRRYDNATSRPRVVKLLRGERLGWWSLQKFVRRARMRALVIGAVNDRRVEILLDTGANGSVIYIQGIGKDKVSTTHKALVKVTLGWEVVYEFEVRPTDFMIPAWIRLDLYNSTAKLPDEVVVPLLPSLKVRDDQTYGLQTADGPTEAVCQSDLAIAEFKLRHKQPSDLTHKFWVRRTDDWIPTIMMNAKGKATRVYLTSTRPTSVWCPAHFPVVIWLPHGMLSSEGYVQLNSAEYRDWQSYTQTGYPDNHQLSKSDGITAKESPPEARKGKKLTCAERWAAVDTKNKATDTHEDLVESNAGLKSQTDLANETSEDFDELKTTDDTMADDPEEYL